MLENKKPEFVGLEDILHLFDLELPHEKSESITMTLCIQFLNKYLKTFENIHIFPSSNIRMLRFIVIRIILVQNATPVVFQISSIKNQWKVPI